MVKKPIFKRSDKKKAEDEKEKKDRDHGIDTRINWIWMSSRGNNGVSA
jgi:hypothetical protein